MTTSTSMTETVGKAGGMARALARMALALEALGVDPVRLSLSADTYSIFVEGADLDLVGDHFAASSVYRDGARGIVERLGHINDFPVEVCASASAYESLSQAAACAACGHPVTCSACGEPVKP